MKPVNGKSITSILILVFQGLKDLKYKMTSLCFLFVWLHIYLSLYPLFMIPIHVTWYKDQTDLFRVKDTVDIINNYHGGK